MSLGLGQLLIILVIIFVLFGAGKLPSLMTDLAKAIKVFRSTMDEKKITDSKKKKDSDKEINKDK